MTPRGLHLFLLKPGNSCVLEMRWAKGSLEYQFRLYRRGRHVRQVAMDTANEGMRQGIVRLVRKAHTGPDLSINPGQGNYQVVAVRNAPGRAVVPHGPVDAAPSVTIHVHQQDGCTPQELADQVHKVLEHRLHP